VKKAAKFTTCVDVIDHALLFSLFWAYFEWLNNLDSNFFSILYSCAVYTWIFIYRIWSFLLSTAVMIEWYWLRYFPRVQVSGDEIPGRTNAMPCSNRVLVLVHLFFVKKLRLGKDNEEDFTVF